MADADSNVNLRRFDLNLLPILRALLATNSVARASEMLGLSQSATSGALSRLRVMFGDPLLILVGRQLVPTPYAEELAGLLNSTFVNLHQLLDKRVFVPNEESRCFVVCSSDFTISDIGPPLIRLLAEEAPNVSLRFVEVSNSHLAGMINGEIDFMIAPQTTIDPKSGDYLSAPLYEDEMVIISSPDYPMPEGGLDLETYLAANHASYGVANSETFEEWALARTGLKKRSIVTVPQFNQLPRYVSVSNCLAMLPRHVAEFHAASMELRIWPAPFDMPKLQVAILWSHVLDRNPAHRWFRDLVSRASDLSLVKAPRRAPYPAA